jgi:transcriptional regulator with XRE-family HTH domain
MVIPKSPGAGELLRSWRQRRRLSQLDLALDAEVSPRHLSFVETGRSNPSRELLMHLAEQLQVPLRERNALLLAAGYAPIYSQRPLGDATMGPVRDALEKILTGHEPYPAIVFDQRFDLVAANRPALALLSDGVAPELLAPPVNVLRVALDPRGLAPRIANLAEVGAHLLARLQRQAMISGDAALAALRAELAAYPGLGEPPATLDPAAMLFVPVRVRRPDGTELRLFSTVATFGTALDVTLAELAIESFFPADEETAAHLRATGAGRRMTQPDARGGRQP